jgi:hypothetical protein
LRWFAAVAIASLVVVGCHNPVPPAPTVDAFYSQCGHPGDTGNELGIGKFCQSLDDCSSTPSAPLCSILGSSTTFFCTTTCSMTGSASQCGTATQCVCNSGNQCGCTPSVCLH